MLSSLTQKRTALLLLPVAFVFFLLLIYFSESTYDAGDGIRHYLISRYSWKHPALLLDSWGKPFFTLVASPFAQFGLFGISVFNVLCGVLSAWFVFRIAQLMQVKVPLLGIPFLLFMPCYFPVLNSGLTEPFFGLILIASIFLVFNKKYGQAALLVSFLPMVRTEGYLLLPLFFLVLLYLRQYKAVLLLATGTIVYSIAGYFYYHDFLWIKNQNPYNGANRAFYGSGELLHFVKNHNFIFGTTLVLLFLAGLAAWVLQFYRKYFRRQNENSRTFAAETWLVYGCFAVYFVAHSFMWWKGLANSLGLLRVIAGVAPCVALICLRGFDLLLFPQLERIRFAKLALIVIAIFMVIRSPFKHSYYPFALDAEKALVKEAADWYKTSAFAGKKVFYLYPYFSHELNVDPFDPDRTGELWGLYPLIKTWGIESVADSTLVLWDAHFGPNECQIPLDTIMADPHFELVKKFTPAQEFTTLGGYRFEIYAFMRRSD